jgi:hypothetical protein
MSKMVAMDIGRAAALLGRRGGFAGGRKGGLSMPDDRQRAINDYSTGIVTTMGAIAGYSNGTDTQDEFVVLDAW